MKFLHKGTLLNSSVFTDDIEDDPASLEAIASF